MAMPLRSLPAPGQHLRCRADDARGRLQQALDGKGEGGGGGLTGVIGGAVGIATLKAALDIAQSKRRN